MKVSVLEILNEPNRANISYHFKNCSNLDITDGVWLNLQNNEW